MNKDFRKRKPRRKGAVDQLDKAVRSTRSMRMIHHHQLSMANKKPTNFREMRVQRIEIISGVVCISGRQERGSGGALKVMINAEFCKKIVDVGFKIRVHPPWTALNLSGVPTLTGITEWENIEPCRQKVLGLTSTPEVPARTDTTPEAGPEAQARSEAAGDRRARVAAQHLDIRCICLTNPDEEGFCDEDGIYESLQSYAAKSGTSQRNALKKVHIRPQAIHLRR